MINLAEIKPNVVSRDLRGYSFLFYGGPKVGKTTLATRFPKHLLLAFEKGYNALPGVMALPINSWAEFLQVLAQLKADRKKYDIATAKGEHYEQMFQTIIIDIADIAYDYCEKYILAQNAVSKVADIPYGGGYALIANEFDSKLRSIVQMGYGLILISHEKIIQGEDNSELKHSTCTLGSRPKNICTRLVDIYGYVTVEQNEEGVKEHYLHVRGTPEWDAGSRFKYMEDTIPLTYNSLVRAVNNSIDKIEQELGTDSLTTNEVVNNYKADDKPDYKATMDSINKLIAKIMDKAIGISPQEAEQKKAIIASIVNKYLGENEKLKDATPNQIEQLIMIEMELREVE